MAAVLVGGAFCAVRVAYGGVMFADAVVVEIVSASVTVIAAVLGIWGAGIGTNTRITTIPFADRNGR
ncbi:Uncharacterised protein [uncultured archaeon]|nr:Uncharacterised protein [uncultured archaeon]